MSKVFRCQHCDKEAEGRANAKFCKPCSQKNTLPLTPYAGLTTAAVGAIGELRACSDLLSKGYEVFRALTYTCSCDLVILKDGKLYRVEVKTGYFNIINGVRSHAKPSNSRFDILCIAYPDRIDYHPSLSSSNNS